MPPKLPGLDPRYSITNLERKTNLSDLYRGLDQENDRQVIVKKSLREEEYFREVVASMKMFSKGDNEHIVPVLAAYPEQMYLVMPYMEGGDVMNLCGNKNGLTPKEVYAITIQVCFALDDIHAVGMIHNDIKPENILLTYAGGSSSYHPLAKLSDFGLSLSEVSEPRWGAGTPQLMAPENLTGLCRPTAASDIYSLGVVMYELFTNRFLFKKESNRKKTIPKDKRIPSSFLSVIRTACEYEISDRYRTISEMVTALHEAV